MKKIIIMICSVLICSLVQVNAIENDEIKACAALSNEKQYCSINNDDECECFEISISLTGVNRQDED